MAVDITLLFRASVKTVKTRNKALGVAVGGGVEGSRDELFRRSPRPKGDFSSRAREVISHIGKLRDFLLEHRKDYINAYSHVMSEYGRMTDTERDQIDQDAQTFMRTCSEAIQQLRTQAHKEIHSQQVKEHRTAVLDFIEDYLKRVCKLYSEQRAIRVKRVVDKKRLSKLEPEPNAKTRESMSSEKVSQSPSKDSEEKPIPEEYPEKVPVEAQPELGSWGDGKGEDELSPEEIQMFEQENQRLIGEMNSLFDEVRRTPAKPPQGHPCCPGNQERPTCSGAEPRWDIFSRNRRRFPFHRVGLNGKLKGKWLKSPDSKRSSQRRFYSKKPRLTVFTS
uniref:SNARE-complex protein Syntaxin-18 N-terminal domain-containing protein n=1 Tax=Capra hircus TaxID=9925 RepID=A0A8C2QTF3_CAPHI